MEPLSDLVADEGKYDYQLYNLSEDPSENINLFGQKDSLTYNPIYVELKHLLDEHVSELLDQETTFRLPSSTDAKPPSAEEEFDEKHLQRLKDLGYL